LRKTILSEDEEKKIGEEAKHFGSTGGYSPDACFI
jgi:hypothetical protein